MVIWEDYIFFLVIKVKNGSFWYIEVEYDLDIVSWKVDRIFLLFMERNYFF